MTRLAASPLSLQGLLWRFLAGGILIFVLLALNLLYHADRIKTVAQAERQQQARTEVATALEMVSREAQRLLQRLVEWDEVDQQLRTPAYYSYWRSNRIEQGHEMPAFVLDVELYDADGRTLLRREDAVLPTQIPTRRRDYQYRDGRLLLLAFAEVADRTDSNRRLGHVGIAVDVLAAMRSLKHFTHLHPDSLGVQPFEAPLPDEARLLEVLEFRIGHALPTSPLERLIKWNLFQFSALLVGLITLLYFLLRHYVTQPMQHLVAYLDGLRTGTITVDDTTSPIQHPIREFATLQASLQRYQQELDQAYHRLDSQNNELHRLAMHDHLTGVWNRRAFDQDWENLVSLLHDQRLNIAYLLVDCNHFKAINDTYGHATGDRVLAIIAEILQQTLRRGDKLYRLGGDEFAAILIDVQPDQVENVAERCHNAVAVYPFNDIGIREPVSVSIGIAIAEHAGQGDLRRLPGQADLAMYHAKKQRRHVCRYRDEMGGDSAILSSHKVSTVLRAVNDQDNIELHYQPIHSAAERVPVYYEALIRLRDRHDNLVFPQDIFPVIERHTLDADLDHAVIRAIEADLAAGLVPHHSGVSINLSSASIVDRHLERHLTCLLPHLAHYRIVLEVTETSLISQLQVASRNLEKLQRLGFRIALDDFGSGYSSLRYLANMPVDIVKFDITMIQALHESERSRIMIEHIARLIREAGYDLVAEGIEDEATLELVYCMGATHAQGYYLGRPQRGVRDEGRGTSGEEQRLCAVSGNGVQGNQKRANR